MTGHYYIAFTHGLRRSGGYVKWLGMDRRLMSQPFLNQHLFVQFSGGDAAGSCIKFRPLFLTGDKTAQTLTR